MADLIPPMLIKLQADVQDLKVGLAQAESAIKGVDNSVKTASTGMTNFVGKIKQVGASLGIAFAGAQVLQFGRDVIQQAQEAEAQQQRLYQLMKVGTGATDEQVASLNAQAEALQKVGVVTAGNITQTQSQLATFNLQTDTIKTLTPAILDYVTAEKGAAAGADEFKQMTNGLAQALNGNFGSLTRVGFVIDENTKKQISSGTEAQRAAAIVEVLNSTYKDFNKELRNTPEGRMQVLRNDFDQLKEDLGKKLLPALKIVTDFLTDQLIPGLRTFGTFLKNNSTTILVLTGAIIGGVAAYKAYLAIQKLVAITTTVLKVAQVLFTGATLASIASTNGLAASMLALNAAMRNNPIGIIVTAIGLLVAGFIVAYKKSETFRNVVATVAKAVLSYVAFMVRAWGEMITIIMKVITGPMRLFLGVMSKLPGVGGAAKQGLKLVNGAIEGVGNFAEKTANKIEGLKAKVDSFTAAANKSSKVTKDIKDKTDPTKDDTGPTGGLDEKQKKKLEGYKKDVAKIYKDMNEAIADAQEKAQEVLDRRNEVMFKAHKDYDEKVAELNKRFREANDEADKRFAEAKADAQKRRDKAETEAYKRNKEALESIEKDYAEKKADLLKANNEKLDDIRKKAADKTADLTKAAAEKQASIVQQGVDRLRNAFASKTGFDLGEAFKGGADNADKLLADLKTKLAAAKELQANAAKLAGMGYSQVFIEEVVKQGPEAGNKIAEALKAASPEATTELQQLYFGLEDVSKNGLNELANQMSTSTSFATQEMMDAYNQVSIDLKESLAEVNAQMNEALAESNKAYAEAIAEAEKDRTEKIASANKALTEALADSKVAYDEALADATKALTEARERAQKDLSEGLAEAQKTLQEALLEAQKDYEKAIDEINKSTMKKIAELQDKLREVAALMRAISAASAAAALASAPTYTPIVATTTPGVGGTTTSTSTQTNISNTFVATKVDASDVHLATLSAIKYGQAVTVPTKSVNTTTLAGIMAASATGGSSSASGITRAKGGRGALID
jgi:vacuolar-type H+-ATPase subunit H